MKRLSILLVVLIMGVLEAMAARQTPVRGRVVDEEGRPVAFATVVLLDGERQVAGVATDADGSYLLQAPDGNYLLNVQFLGYETYSAAIVWRSGMELPEVVLRMSATEIEGVEVTARIVRREADRFVVDVANSPVAVGKDGVDILETAPGVWISDDKISINGKSGTKVYVNDRELKMESEQLLSYLRSLRAEDVAKIEVVPLSGADYDADSSSGIIMITLKRKRDDGVEGSVSYTYEGGRYTSQHNPYLTLNYHQGKVNLYASGWFVQADDEAHSEENTTYHLADMSLRATTLAKNSRHDGGGKLGGVYEFDSRHSVGAEVEYWGHGGDGNTPSTTEVRSAGELIQNTSLYKADESRDHVTVSLNYICKLDTLGSTLKILADYVSRSSDAFNDNQTSRLWQGVTSDSLYYDRSSSRYHIYTASLAWEQYLAPAWRLKAGAKYTRNDMRNSAEYRYLLQEEWQPSTVSDYRVDYTENIGALYAVVSGRVGRFSLSAGLRGEYTHTQGKASGVGQNYFSFFPNAHLSWSMDKAGKHSLIASYARTITRPGFWALSPSRSQISDYTYQMGNPELDPAFGNDLSLTLVLGYKYTLSVGMQIKSDEIQQLLVSDAEDPRNLVMTFRNYPDFNNYYASVSAPVQLTKWWSWNTNLNFVRMGQRVEMAAPLEYSNILQAYSAMTFQLPAKFTFECSYHGNSKVRLGNITLQPNHQLNLSLKKRLLKDRLTLSFDARSLLDRPMRIATEQADFVRKMRIKQSWGGRSFRVRLSYNFQAGKAFKSRSVESASADDRSRLGE